MTLASGATLGPYEILSPLGAGGMGEVYRARDSKLDREVAIKVLPDTFARDPERVARFQREAKVLASLNHPNIAAIYGFETTTAEARKADGVRVAPASLPVDQEGRRAEPALACLHEWPAAWRATEALMYCLREIPVELRGKTEGGTHACT